jgi:hypothetical protein
MKSSEPLKKLKNQSRPLVRPSSVNFCQNFLHLSHETVLRNTISNPEGQYLSFVSGGGPPSLRPIAGQSAQHHPEHHLIRAHLFPS